MDFERASFANYQIEERLGQGGQSQVYRALDLSLKRTVAISSCPTPTSTTTPPASGSCSRRMGFLGANHPNIATVFHIGDELATFRSSSWSTSRAPP